MRHRSVAQDRAIQFFISKQKESEVIYMKIRLIFLAGATVMLLTTGSAFAVPNNNGNGNSCNSNGAASLNPACLFKAPEIDAASGTSAIALLVGALLLAGERSRSRRS